MATDEELSEYLCEHYAYELQMMRFTLGELGNANMPYWNAMLEACAAHARTLRDFYTRCDRDDRSSFEYGVSTLTLPDNLRVEFRAINKQVAHLDKARPFGNDARKLTAARS